VTPNGAALDIDLNHLQCACGYRLSEFDACPNCQNTALIEHGAYGRSLPPRASRQF
jgi:hypothetical protein